MPDSLGGCRIALVLGNSLGGVGRHVHALTRALVRHEVEVTVFAPEETGRRFDFAASGATFEAVEIPDQASAPQTIAAARQLRRRLTQFDLVHAHGFRAGLTTMRARGRPATGVPFVATWHNVPSSPRPFRAAARRLEARLGRRAHLSIAVSPDLAARLRALGARDVRLMPVGALGLPSPARGRSEVVASLQAAGRPIVFAFGRLHSQKGFDVLIEAAARWQHQAQPHPHPVLVIAGDGPEATMLKATARAHGVEVRWLGYVSDRQRLADLLAAADIVAVPSRWEGSPLAVHEALLAGSAIVATRVGGLPSMVDPDSVAFVAPDDATALANAVCRLIDNPDQARALRRRAATTAGRWPDADEAAERVLQVYAELRTR